MGEFMKFEMLADSIKEINVKAGNIAKCAVNQLMTLRNWAIGYYIVEYEQGGSDRASYGTRLLKNLEEQISEKGMNSTLFKWCQPVLSFCIPKLVQQCHINLDCHILKKVRQRRTNSRQSLNCYYRKRWDTRIVPCLRLKIHLPLNFLV